MFCDTQLYYLLIYYASITIHRDSNSTIEVFYKMIKCSQYGQNII